MNNGAIRHSTNKNGAGVYLIRELFWVEYFKIFPLRNAAAGLVGLEPVLLESFDAITSPGTIQEWAMYPMREVGW